jgi:hypothetical protein
MLGEIFLEPDKDGDFVWAVTALKKKPLIQEISRTDGFPLTLAARARFDNFLSQPVRLFTIARS